MLEGFINDKIILKKAISDVKIEQLMFKADGILTRSTARYHSIVLSVLLISLISTSYL